MSANKCNKYNYQYVSMIKKCSHLHIRTAQWSIASILLIWRVLFRRCRRSSRRKGPCWLNPTAKLYSATVFSIPQALYQAAWDELVKKRVLIKNVRTAWTSPSFFRSKKDGGVRSVSDLQKLNEQLVRRLFPTPNIEDVIWKMNALRFSILFLYHTIIAGTPNFFYRFTHFKIFWQLFQVRVRKRF